MLELIRFLKNLAKKRLRALERKHMSADEVLQANYLRQAIYKIEKDIEPRLMTANGDHQTVRDDLFQVLIWLFLGVVQHRRHESN